MDGTVALLDEKNVQQIACPQCETTYKVGPEHLKAGANFKCSKCGKVFPLNDDEPESNEPSAGWKIRLKKSSKEIQVGSIDKLKRLIIEGKICADDELVWKDGRAKPLGEIDRFAPFFRVRQLSNDLKAVGQDDAEKDASSKSPVQSAKSETTEGKDNTSLSGSEDASRDADTSSDEGDHPSADTKPFEGKPDDDSEQIEATDGSEPAQEALTQKPAEASTEVQSPSQFWPVVIMLTVLAAIAVAIFLATR